MLYLLIICHDDTFVPAEPLVEAIRAWDLEMERRGVLRDGQPLRPPGEAVTLRVRDGECVPAEGPFADTPDKMAAYELLECASMEEAVELAATHPMASAGAIEVRPVWEELTQQSRLSRMSAHDQVTIRSLESAYDRAWNAGDIESMLRLFAEDVVVVDPSGGLTVGREGMRRSLEALFAGRGRGSRHRSELTGVRFVADGVALVDGEAVIHGFGTDGDEMAKPLRHNFTDVLVKRDGTWLIVEVRAYAFLPRFSL